MINRIILVSAIFILYIFDCDKQKFYADEISFNNGITIRGEEIYFNGKPFLINAVGYAGWRPGQWPGTDVVPLDLVAADFQRIKDAGFNTIRTWEALSPQELELAMKFGLKVIQGIWLDPSHDFSDEQVKRYSLDKMQRIVQWSKRFDNVLMYLVFTEPRQEAVMYAGEEATISFLRLVKKTIQDIDYKPVSMDSWIPLGFLDHELWDIVTFNVFMFTPETINKTIGFKNYVAWIKQNHARHKPLFIGETGGFSVSRKRLNDIGFGGNTSNAQSLKNIESLKLAIEGGASGVCLVSFLDTWHYPSDPERHDDHPWEWNGLIEFKSRNDSIGTPRQTYYDFKASHANDQDWLGEFGYKRYFSNIHLNIVSNAQEFSTDDVLVLTIEVDKGGVPIQRKKVAIGFFDPIDWHEELRYAYTDQKGKAYCSYPLKGFKHSFYLIISAGVELKGEKSGDIKFFRINHRQNSFQKKESKFYVYYDKDFPGNHFYPSGWVGDYEDLVFNDNINKGCHSGKTCIEVAYSAEQSHGGGWAGIYWQDNVNNWNDDRYGFNLQGYKGLSFWARGKSGGEKISVIGVGGGPPNSIDTAMYSVELTDHWKEYRIDLVDKNLAKIIHGFRFFVLKDDQPYGSVFYLDDIVFYK